MKFVIGKVHDPVLEADLHMEEEQYQDIVRVNVQEGYFNLTLKVLTMLESKWRVRTDFDPCRVWSSSIGHSTITISTIS